MRDADGQPVHSRLDEQALRAMAQATGGAYAALGPVWTAGSGALYRMHLAQLPRRTIMEARMRKGLYRALSDPARSCDWMSAVRACVG